MFRGTFTALVTPFRDGGIDTSAFEKLIEAQIAAGITGIVAVGTTGESPTLSHEEREQLIRLAVATAKKRCQVLAGTGSNATHHAVAVQRSIRVEISERQGEFDLRLEHGPPHARSMRSYAMPMVTGVFLSNA